MSFSVGLYRDFARKGGITFSTQPATQSSGYVSKTEIIPVFVLFSFLERYCDENVCCVFGFDPDCGGCFCR